MKLLMTADVAGGVWTYALTLAEALAPHGIEIVLATMGPAPSPAQRRAVAERDNVSLVTSTYKLEWMEQPWHDLQEAARWLLELADRTQPDLVHLNGYAHAALPWGRPTVVVAHSCVLSWWRAVHGRAAPAAWDRYRSATGQGLHAAGLVVAPSYAMLAALQREHGPVPRSRVIPNGADPQRAWIAHKEQFVLAAGRLWDDAKNVAALERVAPALPWPVFVAGEGRPRSRGTVGTLGLIAPEVLGAWMACAAIFAHPARYEPFGLSILEAALSGCALVLGDIPSLREHWDAAALFVPPGDDVALRDALIGLIRDSGLRRTLGTRGRARALDNYGLRALGSAYAATYQRLTREPARAAACV
jgi:glycogen synthase